MTPQEAIQRIKTHNEIHSKKEPFAVYITEALQMAIQALEKQIPMMHHHTKVVEVHDDARISVCPHCLNCIITNSEEFPRFCNWCGQAIEWEE